MKKIDFLINKLRKCKPQKLLFAFLCVVLLTSVIIGIVTVCVHPMSKYPKEEYILLENLAKTIVVENGKIDTSQIPKDVKCEMIYNELDGISLKFITTISKMPFTMNIVVTAKYNQEYELVSITGLDEEKEYRSEFISALIIISLTIGAGLVCVLTLLVMVLVRVYYYCKWLITGRRYN